MTDLQAPSPAFCWNTEQPVLAQHALGFIPTLLPEVVLTAWTPAYPFRPVKLGTSRVTGQAICPAVGGALEG